MLWSAIAACSAIAVLLGIWRLRRGGPEGRCSRCDQIVDGIPSTLCPECGADLLRSGMVRRYLPNTHRRLAVAATLVLLCSLPRLGYYLYTDATAPGWQEWAPAWWLSEVEMRFSSGSRVDDASAGLLWAKESQHVSDSEFKGGARRAFERMSEILNNGRTPPPSLKLLARTAANDGAISAHKIATAIYASTKVTQWTARSELTIQTDLGGLVECGFLPNDWELDFEYEIRDADGKSVGNHGGGQYQGWSDAATVFFKDPIATRSVATGPYTCVWNFRVFPIGSPNAVVKQWTVVNPFRISPSSPEHDIPGPPSDW